MSVWPCIAGGRIIGNPLKIGVLGYSVEKKYCFSLSDSDWERIVKKLPLEQLQQYGQGNGLFFEKIIDNTEGFCGFLLVSFADLDSAIQINISDARLYLVLEKDNDRYKIDANSFNKIFVPGDAPFYDTKWLYLDAPEVFEKEFGCEWYLKKDESCKDYSSVYIKSADFWITRVTCSIASDLNAQYRVGPLLSVIVPCYNYSKYIGQCISSVLSQDVEDIEIIILDNASDDDTKSVVAEFLSDKRVRYIQNRHNYGAGRNWVNGLTIASGKYFSFLSADDFLNPGYLKKMLGVMLDNSDVAVGYTRIRWVDSNGQELNQPPHPGYRDCDYVGGRNEVADLLRYDNYMAPSAVIFDRKKFLDVWRPTDSYGAGDWEMNVQMAERHPNFAYLNCTGVSYRWHGNQYSTSFYNSIEPLLGHIAVLSGVFKRNAQVNLKGFEIQIADALERRLGLYPAEIDSEVGKKAKNLIQKLKDLKLESERPFFSVILTTYNRPQLLRYALDSLAKQNFKDFEVCLVNDAGEAVEDLLIDRDYPVYYIRQGKNLGLSAARNAALKIAKGRYIAYLDDDDLYHEDHLLNLADTFNKQPNVVAYTGVEYVNEKLEHGKRIEQSRKVMFAHDQYDRDRLFVQNYIPVNTWAHPRDSLADVGDFDTTLSAFEDWDMLLRLAQRYEFVHIPNATAEVRVRTNTDSSDHMLHRERKNFSALYQKIYRRYPVLGNDELEAKRKQLLTELISAEKASVAKPISMSKWIEQRNFNNAYRQLVQENLTQVPCIRVLVVDLENDSSKVQETLDSLAPHQDFAVATVFTTESISTYDSVATVTVTSETLLHNVQRHLKFVEDGWFLIVKAGDQFTPVGLTVAALELAKVGQCRAIYADEMMRNQGKEPGLLMRPDLNLDLLLSFPAAMARHWLFNVVEWQALGGFNEDFVDAFELEYILRLIEQGGFEGLGHVAEPLLIANPFTLSDQPQEREVILKHLASRGYTQASIDSQRAGRYQINYAHTVQPTVSIVIAVHANMAWAVRCVESILEKSSYPHYEIVLIDCSSGDEAISAWLAGISQMSVDRLRVFDGGALSYPRLCNEAVNQCNGDILLFLDSSIGIIDGDWLAQLLNHACRPEVGVVGAKLVGVDGKITHAGWHLGVNGVATPAFAGEPIDAPGYVQRLQVDQNYAAVSGKCLMIRTALFLEVGGFEVESAIEPWLDIDLCLRVQQAGYLNVWTPRVQLLVSEASQPKSDSDASEAMFERWLPLLARDPAYNPNASVIGTPFSLAPSELSWRPGPLLGRPTVLAHMGDQHGCGHYRVIQPFRALKAEGLIDGALAGKTLDVVNLERYSPDSIVMQRLVTDDQHSAMRSMRKFSKAFKVYELDDYLPNLPVKNMHRAQMPKGILKAIRTSLSYVDRFVVSTEALADAFKGMHGDIRVVKNSLDPQWWSGLESLRRTSSKPRVGWAGGLSHDGDLALVADVVRALSQEVEWVFFGMCPEEIRPYVHEFHPGVLIEQYPAKLASLNLDLAIAPVEQNLFNECKSNLRLLEYGVLGIPVVASDIGCYRQDGLPVTLVRNRFKDWVDAIRMHLSDGDASLSEGRKLRAVVEQNWMLKGERLEAWYQAWLETR